MECQSSDFVLSMFVQPPPTYYQTYFIALDCEQFYQSLPPGGRHGETEHRVVGVPQQAAG